LSPSYPRDKEQAVLDRLAHAKQLCQWGDLKATDAQGAPHCIGRFLVQVTHQAECSGGVRRETADALIHGGVDINKQDMYQDTALDYLLYTSFEMQTLMVEPHQRFAVAFYDFFKQISAVCRVTAAAVSLS
jgi:hypothetical protein